MITVYNEDLILKIKKSGTSFRSSKYALVVIEKGIIDVEIEDYKTVFFKNDIVILEPNKSYKCLKVSDDLKLYIVLNKFEDINSNTPFIFNKHDLLQTFIDNKNHVSACTGETFSNIITICKQLYYYTNKTSIFNENIKLGLASSLSYLVMERFVNESLITKKDNCRKQEVTNNYLKLVNIHYIKYKNLDFYAKELKISTKYLYNCVRDITNYSPSKYIFEAIINHAKTLLLNPEYTIKEISILLEFSDQYSFGKFFKKHTGINPTKFRENHKIPHFTI